MRSLSLSKGTVFIRKLPVPDFAEAPTQSTLKEKDLSMIGYMYILECADRSYYTGSTIDLDARVLEHQNGALPQAQGTKGANYTRKRLPVKLVYFEEYDRIDEAFYREKQVQRWSRKKKEALINGQLKNLSELSRNYTQFPRVPSTPSTSSGTDGTHGGP